MPADPIPDLWINLADATSVGEARRGAARLSEAAGWGDIDRGRLAIVATELATNVVRHARGSAGDMAIGLRPAATGIDIEVTALDAGPGMNDVGRCLQDGFSTGGTQGAGLGAVRRQSAVMDLYSSSTGTVVWSRVSATDQGSPRTPATTLAVGGLSIPAPGETVCGDGWRSAKVGEDATSVLVCDGLGHGPDAAEAAEAACAVFNADPGAAPERLLESMHSALSGTRGAAIAIARIDPAAGRLRYAGVGNISGTLIEPDGGRTRGLFSHNGTVGHQVRKIQEFEYPWTAGCTLVTQSDGIQTRWSPEKYPGLTRRHPAVLAGVLLRDFKRGRDDATVVAVGPFAAGMTDS